MTAAGRRARSLPGAALAAALLLGTGFGAPGAHAAGPDHDGGGAAPAPRVLRVATSGDYAPFSQVRPAPPGREHEADADLAGFDVELVRAFARDRGYRLEFVRFRWPELGGLLASGGFDLAASGITVKAERSIGGRFSVPVAASRAVAVSWEGTGIRTLDDLDRGHLRVAVNAGGHLQAVAQRTLPHSDLVPIADNEAVRMAMLDRACDAVVTDAYEEKVWTAGTRGAYRVGVLSEDAKAWLVRVDREDLAREVDQWLLAREADGTLAAMRRDLLGDVEEASVRAANPLAALAAAMAERQALMPMVYESKRLAGRPVEDPVQEAAVVDAAAAAVRAAAGAGPAPAEDAVRALFVEVVTAGREAQQALADRDRRIRPGAMQDRRASAGDAAVGDAAAGDADAAARAARAAEAAARSRKRTFDLGSELRPAIARITARMAMLLVALEDHVSTAEARRTLEPLLANVGLKKPRIDAIAEAVARCSSSRRAIGR